jgi:hypothetical protein
LCSSSFLTLLLLATGTPHRIQERGSEKATPGDAPLTVNAAMELKFRGMAMTTKADDEIRIRYIMEYRDAGGYW